MFIFIFVIWQYRIDGVVIDNTYESGFTVNLSIYVIFGVIRTDMLYFCWDFNPHHHAGGDSNSTQLFIPIFDNFHKNLLLQPITTSTSTKSIKKNTIYSCFLRCEPPRVFMGTSPSHGHV